MRVNQQAICLYPFEASFKSFHKKSIFSSLCTRSTVWFDEKFEDDKGVIRSHQRQKSRQCNGQKTKDNRTNKDIQNITLKNKEI
jgi:hypothetical protein